MSNNPQWTDDDLATAYRERRYREIDEARERGELNVVLGGAPPIDADGVLTDADVSQLYRERRYDAIDKARAEGRIPTYSNQNGA